MAQEIEGLNLEGFKREFMLVYNDNASAALEPGDICEFDVISNSPAYPGRSVVDGTAADVKRAGVVVGKTKEMGGNADAIPAGEWGYILRRGHCDFMKTDGGVAEGDLLMSGSAVADTGTLGTNDAACFGVALDADNASSILTNAIVDF